MPVTPFHFGPGAALAALAPRHVSFVAFCAANVVIDVESLYNLVLARHPVHAFFHSYVGATLAAFATIALMHAARRVARRWELPNLFDWCGLARKQIVVGALAGAWSHVVLDSIMHADIAPLAPFSTSNGLLRAVSLDALHGFCAASAIVALAILAWRERRAGD